MHWATFKEAGSTDHSIGVVVGDQAHVSKSGLQLIDLLGDDGEALAREGDRTLADPSKIVVVSDVTILAPIPRPPSVRDFFAFEQHVKTSKERLGFEMDPGWYKIPVFYFTNPAAIIGPDAPVAIPPGCTDLDFELEIAVVVGKGGSDISADAAESHIAGYMIMNDWSARDLQREEMRHNLGPAKGKDFATSIGPYLVTPDELASVSKRKAFDLTMTATVNGKEYSRAVLGDIYWSFGEMLAYASRGTTLVPGDIIGSGTCGTGCLLELRLTGGEEAFPWLKAGDAVELTVEHLGTLANGVVSGRA